MPIRQSTQNMLARNAHATAWSKGDAWKETKGGFNPEVFRDLDEGTRQRLRDHQVGPANLRGDGGGVVQALTQGHWANGRHGSANFFSDLIYGQNADTAHNRGNVQNAAWESGFANIGDKGQLNQFLDRADAVKAQHGDFLKDGWTPEAQMLMRNYKEPQQAPAPAPEPVAAPAPEPEKTTPAVDSDHLAQAKELAQGWGNNKQAEPTESDIDKTTYDRRFTNEKKVYDFSNPSTFTKPTIDGDTKNV